jgi:hypothetical protein
MYTYRYLGEVLRREIKCGTRQKGAGKAIAPGFALAPKHKYGGVTSVTSNRGIS